MCDDFFARARFAFDDDGGVGGRNFFENTVDFSHFDVSADDIAEFFFVRGDDGDFFVEGLEDEFGLPEAERATFGEVGFFDADLVDPSAVGRFEIADDVGVVFLDDFCVVAADGVVFDDEVVVVERSDGDDAVFEDPFATVSDLLRHDAAFAQV